MLLRSLSFPAQSFFSLLHLQFISPLNTLFGRLFIFESFPPFGVFEFVGFTSSGDRLIFFIIISFLLLLVLWRLFELLISFNLFFLPNSLPAFQPVALLFLSRHKKLLSFFSSILIPDDWL